MIPGFFQKFTPEWCSAKDRYFSLGATPSLASMVSTTNIAMSIFKIIKKKIKFKQTWTIPPAIGNVQSAGTGAPPGLGYTQGRNKIIFTAPFDVSPVTFGASSITYTLRYVFTISQK